MRMRNKYIMKIADHYGLDEQLNILQEECAELIQAVSKYRRCRKYASQEACAPIVSEEMADVYIMLEQIKHLMGNKTDIDGWIDGKIARQLERINEEDDNAI